MSVHALVFIQRLDRNPPPNARPHNFPRQNTRLRTNDGAALHAYVIAESHLPANHHVVFNNYAAADSGLSGNHHSLADVAVMTYMDHVVDLRAASNSCLSQGSAIDAGVRSELNVVLNDDCSPLWKFVIAHIVADIAKTIG